MRVKKFSFQFCSEKFFAHFFLFSHLKLAEQQEKVQTKILEKNKTKGKKFSRKSEL